SPDFFGPRSTQIGTRSLPGSRRLDQLDDDRLPFGDLAPAPVGRGQRRFVQRGDQQRRRVLPARAPAGCRTDPSGSACRRRLAMAVLVLTLRVGHVSSSMSRTPISAGPLAEAGLSTI